MQISLTSYETGKLKETGKQESLHSALLLSCYLQWLHKQYLNPTIFFNYRGMKN